jgi:tRNA (mo5U34)-methyltransferase
VRPDELRWYHTIELPGVGPTPGEWDLRPILPRLPLPDSLAGRRCLDIGSRDGFYAFEMERRGAGEVISLDLDDPAKVDFPGERPPEELVRSELDAGLRAFEAARDHLGSSVERRHLSIYELSPRELGEFDFAVIGTLLLHLRDPVAALRAVHGVLRGELLVNEAVVPGLDSLRRRPLAELGMEGVPFYWVANPAGLRRLANATGFQVVRSGGPYILPRGASWEPPTLRSCLRAPLGEIPKRLLLRRGMPHAWLLLRRDPPA